MPPWFIAVMQSCESLSLDSERDRMILWERLSDAWPHEGLSAQLGALLREMLVRVGGLTRDEADDFASMTGRSLDAAVIEALETA